MDCAVENLTKTYKSRPAIDRITQHFETGRISVILGPSGSGKTTLLRCIAGLETADAGTIRLGSDIVHAPADRIEVPPHRRGIGMVFQSYGLWPHFTVAKNIGFPLRIKNMPESDVPGKVRWALEMVGLAGYEGRMPGQLSGGEQQRVALARAFASEPGILLMDEPLSNLDAMLRKTVRLELRELQQRLGITMIYITHDQEEALSLADHLIVMRRAAIAQRGLPEEVYRRPADTFVARFLGAANLTPVKVLSVIGEIATVESLALGGALTVSAGNGIRPGSRAVLLLRPEELTLSKGKDSALVSGNVLQRMFSGNRMGYVLQLDNGEKIHIETDTDQEWTAGDRLWLGRRSEQCGLALADEETG